jgi:tetratricopeptide (TPR) repeat protein
MPSKAQAKAKSKARRQPAAKAKKPAKSLQKKQSAAANRKTARAARKDVVKKGAASRSAKSVARAKPKVESPANKATQTAPAAKKTSAKPTPPQKVRPLAGALSAYEAGIKLMYTENYEKAIKSFNDLIEDFPEEPEIQASARARIHACEMKIQERARSVYRSADDHYNIAIALMNRGEIEPALTHLQSALKLAPKGDHILYAMAAANALRGNIDQALSYLKQSISHRPENRFQAAKDNDFASINEDPGFKELLNLSEK